uniref:Letm1 RBD domain-containing protein n=1 Tax=Otus sunia TaxID=257818 RepID=A0A8C8AAN1_9STRI
MFLTTHLPVFFLRHRLRSHVLEIRHLDRAMLRLGLGQLSEEELRAVRPPPALPCPSPGPSDAVSGHGTSLLQPPRGSGISGPRFPPGHRGTRFPVARPRVAPRKDPGAIPAFRVTCSARP